VAISAFSAEALEVRGVTTPQGLQFHTPGLVVNRTNVGGGGAQVTIRGIGTEQPGVVTDPGVPLHVNGHYTQSTAYVFRDFLDVERVEVQRGPQGTLYGRNAVGGTINIVTKRPTEEVEGVMSLDVGNYDKRLVQAVVSGPLTDGVRGRLAISDEKRDGYVKDLGTNTDREFSDYTSIRGALEVDITDDVQAYLSAYHYDSESDEVFLANRPNEEVLNPFKINTNSPGFNDDKSKGASVDITWQLEGVDLRYLSAYDKTNKQGNYDYDGSSLFNSEFLTDVENETLMQEFQLISTHEGDLNWVLGLFYYDEKSTAVFRGFFDARLPVLSFLGLPAGDRAGLLGGPTEMEVNSLAVYGQANYKLTEQWEAVVGMRYTKDEKTRNHDGQVFFSELDPNIIVSAPGNSATNDWKEPTWKLGLNYHISEDNMLYASYSRGYKAGGYNTNLALTDSYDPEIVDAYDVGLKSQWLDNRVRLNIAAFYYDYKDKQDFQRLITLPATKISNASQATIQGVELEAQAWVTDAFLLNFSLGYLDAEFDEYESIDANFVALGLQDLSGNKVPKSPEFKVSLGAQYKWQLSGMGDLLLRGDYAWLDDQWSNAFNRDSSSGLAGSGDLLPSYHQVNARLQWTSEDENWQAEIYGTNLTDEVIKQNSFTSSGLLTIDTYLPPRLYGFKTTYRF